MAAPHLQLTSAGALTAVTVDEGLRQLPLTDPDLDAVRLERVAAGVVLVQRLPLGDEHAQGRL